MDRLTPARTPGLRWRTVVAAAVTVVALLVGLTALAVGQSRSAVTGQVDARAKDATTSAQTFVQARVDLLSRLVTSYAERDGVRVAVAAGDADALTAPLHQLQGSTPGLVAAWVTDERGTLLGTDRGAASIGQDLSYRDWYRGARRTPGPYLSPGYVNRDAAQTPGFAISVEVRAPGGQVVGVLGTSLSLAAFEQTFVAAMPDEGRTTITDQWGQVLAAPGLDLRRLEDLSRDPGVRRALAGGTWLSRDGGRVGVHAPLAQGWTISTSLPATLATVPNSRLTWTIGAAGAGVGLLLLVALLLLARALAEVEERRRYTATVLDSLDVAVTVCDADGRATYLNPLSRTWHGLPEDAAGLPDVDGAPGWTADDRVRHVDGRPVDPAAWPLVRAMATGGSASEELVLHTAGQPPRRVVVLARPLLAADGTLLGAVAASHDVTLARQQEAELESARDAAMDAAQAKTAFLASMSHEIRTPLNGVLGMLDLVLYDPGLPAGHRTRLEVAASSGQTLLRLLNDVLDMSRGDAVRVALAERTVDLPQLVRSAVAVLSGTAERKGLALEVVLAPDLPQRVTTDPDRLTQVLLNLVGNAVKFTDAGTVSVSVRSSASTLVLTVTDTGPGMDEREQERIFQPFEQGEAGRAHGGTGLGLALTSQVVALFGGELTVRSSPGRGSTFTATIPVVAVAPRTVAPAVPAPQRPEVPFPGFAPHVLLAEDNPVNQLVMEQMLASLGATALVVGDGAQAVQAVASGARFDLVLLDWQMPVMSGPDAATALRAAGAALPLVGLTARTSPEDVRTCLDAGMDLVLAKPCAMADLAQVLRDLPVPSPAPVG